MGKNRNKTKKATNSIQPEHYTLEKYLKPIEDQTKATAQLVANNSFVFEELIANSSAFMQGGVSQTLYSANAYSNIMSQILTLEQLLLTYLYKTYGILAKIIDIPVDDAYKGGGFDLEADTISEKELIEFQKEVRKRDIEPIKTARKWARLFGGAAIIALSGNDLKQPLNLETLQGKPVEFMAVDRWQLAYSLPNVEMRGGFWSLTQNSSNEFDANAMIHPSRVFILHGKRAPYLISQQVQGWGLSILEFIFQEMSQFFKARNVMFELLDEAKIDILKLANLQSAVTAGGAERSLKDMINMIARCKNYKSLIAIGGNDEYDQKTMSFSGFEGILREIRIMIAGAANMPVNKIWGEGVTGFGSGEDSLENYNSQIENEIRTPDEDLIDWVLKIRAYQMFGHEIDGLTKDWKNLRVLSAMDEQNIHDHVFANVMQLFDRQLLTPQETMEYLKKKQIFVHDSKALKGELEDSPLITQDREKIGFKDITK